MFEEGFISIDRKIVNWEWYKDANTKALFLHLLFIANWKDGRFKGHEVPRGSVITSIAHLSQDTGLSRKAVRTALKHLQMTHEVAIKGTNKFSLITIEKYDFYQNPNNDRGKQKGNQRASKGQARGNQRATIEQYNNNNNDNNKNNSLSASADERENFSVELVEQWANEFDDPNGKIVPAGYVAHVKGHGGNKDKDSFDSYCYNILHLQKIGDKKQKVETKTPEQIRQEEIDKWYAE